jgi:hypothetical protein
MPEDTSEVDPDLAPGSIVVEVRDQDEQPLPQADVTLGIMQQSVAKGESHRRMTAKTGPDGVTRFEHLEFGGGVAYRVTVPRLGKGGELATYAAFPFQLDLHHGQRVLVHVYPVTSRIEESLVGVDGIIYVEIKDDVLQFDELFKVYNLGPVTWVPGDVVIELPRGFKAFNAQKVMGDTGFDEVEHRGARLRGTFSPGTHEAAFRYQVPYEPGDAASLSFTLPPHVARMRVITEAARGMTLRVADFPNAEADRNQRGQRVLFTERQLRAGQSPMSRLEVTLGNLPGPGPGRWWTASLATCIVALGVYTAVEQQRADKRGKKSPGKSALEEDAARARTRLVEEIAALERAHESGQIGPNAYARLRQMLIDAVARLLPQR